MPLTEALQQILHCNPKASFAAAELGQHAASRLRGNLHAWAVNESEGDA
jgi:hypothetical protein